MFGHRGKKKIKHRLGLWHSGACCPLLISVDTSSKKKKNTKKT
jgi:hypothetical protein